MAVCQQFKGGLAVEEWYCSTSTCDATLSGVCFRGIALLKWHQLRCIEYVKHVYLVCGVAVPNNEFAVLGGADQKPGEETRWGLTTQTVKTEDLNGPSMCLQAQQKLLKSLQLFFFLILCDVHCPIYMMNPVKILQSR